MKNKILVIGSVVADVIITLPHLPSRGEDVHVRTQTMRLGGCAFNTFSMIRHFGVEAVPFFPVGKGPYGRFVREELAQRGIHSPIPEPEEENGCCYCFVENDGERTFLSYHGAEYRFYPEWFETLDAEQFQSVYICGLEIEEKTGGCIVDFLEKHPSLSVFFAPGPRLTRIGAERMRRIFELHPILHLNEEEALSFTGKAELSDAARAFLLQTGNTVIITRGSEGCSYFDGQQTNHVSAFPVSQVDTIGAGDAHIGAVMACLAKGSSMGEAIQTANLVSSKVVNVEGATLSDAQFRELGIR